MAAGQSTTIKETWTFTANSAQDGCCLLDHAGPVSPGGFPRVGGPRLAFSSFRRVTSSLLQRVYKLRSWPYPWSGASNYHKGANLNERLFDLTGPIARLHPRLPSCLRNGIIAALQLVALH